MLTIVELRKNLNADLERHKYLITQIKEEKKQLEKAESEVKTTTEAQQYLQEIAQQTQQQAHKQVAKIVSKCLSSVFEEPYELRIEFERKRGKTDAEFVFLRNGRKVKPLLTSGGVRDVTALALRLVSLVLTLPPARRVLVLDEPFGALSARNLVRMASLIQTLSRELGIQFVIVSHDEALQIGKVIELGPASLAVGSKAPARPASDSKEE